MLHLTYLNVILQLTEQRAELWLSRCDRNKLIAVRLLLGNGPQSPEEAHDKQLKVSSICHGVLH
jgi:hypothetical protein